jgi:G:T-mismatch repair DNA endonuclease (very short patch repair protein)
VKVRTLSGQPDVVVPGLRLTTFADGCLYHGCPEHGHTPKSNVGYWLPKLVRNRRRDRASRRALRRMGFAVWRLWEHELGGSRMARTQLTEGTLPWGIRATMPSRRRAILQDSAEATRFSSLTAR